MTTLIYDRDIDGHHLNFISLLANDLAAQPAHVRERVVFVVNPKAQPVFEHLTKTLRFHFIDKSEIEVVDNQSNVIKKAAIQVAYLTTLAKQYNASKLVFMHLDAFQIELGKSQNLDQNLEIWGILFNPFRREYEDASTPRLWIKRQLKSLRRGMMMRWMLQNKQIKRIFILNDKKGVAQHNQQFGNVFKLLADPIDMSYIATESVEVLRARHDIPKDKCVMLVFGSLSPRKNLENILKSFEHLNASHRQKLCLLIAGMPEKPYELALNTILSNAELKFPEITFIKKYQFLETQTSEEIFALSDTVLIPYVNFFNSSGVIGMAAKYNKPVIASKFGVMSDLVQEYTLGTIADPTDCIALAQRIVEQLKSPTKIDGHRFLNKFSAQHFCQELLKF